MHRRQFTAGTERASKRTGVTLIELVVVLATIAILAAIAVPGYHNYVLRTHRVEAKSALLNLAVAQEKFYLTNNTYATNAQLTDPPPGGLGLPATTENGWYAIATSGGATGAGFTATATAAGAQAQDKDCASFTIDALGVKSARNKSNGDSSAACWN
jgi:type IV pilus assembly protein PilE